MRWSWQPDGLKRLEVASSAVDTWTFGLRSADELETVTRGSQGLSVASVGTEGRPESLTPPEGSLEDLRWDREGRRLEDGRFLYTWDWRGRLVQVDVKTDAPVAAGDRVAYGYDALGRLLSRTVCEPAPDSIGCGVQGSTFLEKRAFL